MSFLEYLKNNRARVILFLTSFSVILITLGIIQTLLFESINFFSELAESRGWFTFDWDFVGITSGTGIAAAIFLLVYIAELFIINISQIKTSLEFEIILFPKQFVIYITAALLVVQFFVLDTLLMGVAFVFVFITWRRLASAVNKQRYGMQLSDSTLWRNISLGFFLIALAKSITMNYGGALGEFFLTTNWNPALKPVSFGVNSLLLTTLQVAFGALIIAVPLGVGCAIYLSEYAPPRLVAVFKPTLELLAGIPSVVYGFFAFIYIGPLVVE